MRVRSLLVDSLDVLCLKWQMSDDESVEDDTNGLCINFETVAIGSVEKDFGGDIIGRSTNSLLLFPRVLDESGKTKVANLDVHVHVKEDVAEFQVAVDNLVVVHVVAGTKELNHEVSRLWFGETLAAAEQVHEGAVVAEF